MGRQLSELAHRLAREAEAVCRHYLSNGRRQGRYWTVGDARNTPGRSMFVRLIASPKGPAGKWTDAATGEHGDLLDIIRESCGLVDFRDVAGEARRFLNLPRSASALSSKVVGGFARGGRAPLRHVAVGRRNSRRPICVAGTLHLSAPTVSCASTRTVTTDPMRTPKQRSGRH